MSRRLLRIAVLYIPLFILGALISPFLVFWTRLPEPIATHWSDAPNGSMPKLGALSLVVGLWLFFAVRAAWPTVKHTEWDDPTGETASYGVPPLATLYFVAGVLLVAQTSMIWANLDAAHWTAANHLPTVPFLAAVLGLALALAGIGRMLEHKLSDEHSRTDSTPAPLDLDLSERAMWWGHATNHWLLVPTLGVSAWLFLLMSEESNVPFRYAMPLIIATIGLLFANVHVVVGGHNVTIELGVWRWPRKVIPVGEINGVAVQRLHPLRHGGWGYRSCGAGCRAFIIRGGDALVLKQESGRTTMVTVNDAHKAAALVEALINRPAPDTRKASPTVIEDA